MSTTIKLRRSSVAGRIPTTSQLDLGELAINTQDGKIYFKQYDSVSNTESIIDISSNLDAAAILAELLTVDGAGTGLDSDLLDGEEGSYYLDYNNFTNVPPATLDLTLDGKVTGNAFSNTGVMTLTTELANTGVTANTYGSSTQIPVLTVDEDGRITLATTAAVSGVEDFTYDSSNNQITLETGDGSTYNLFLNEFKDITVEDLTANTLNIGSFTSDALDVGGDISANNIIVDGLVDGRDIAADGAKLDNLEDGLDLTLTGKVTGTASSNTGVMSLVTELANTGVTAGVYGSSTEIPVFTVDEDGRLTTANTTSVAGVDDFTYATANNTITLQTGDGTTFNIQTETEVTLTGKVTGTASATDGNISIATELENTGVTANTYGSATSIPVITVDEDGRITVANTAAVSGVEDFQWYSANNTLQLETGDGTFYNVIIDEFDAITANTVNGRDITADGTKLDGIEDNATADQTAAEILAELLTVDGTGSGLDADLLDGQHASDIVTSASDAAAEQIGNGRVDITAGSGLSGSGGFNLNDFSNTSITLTHDDTSSVSNTALTDGNVVNGITFDEFGHAQAVTSIDLDGRYYTETEADSQFVNVSGDTMTGDLTVNANIIQEESVLVSTSATTTTTSETAIYAFAHGTYGGAEVVIQVTQGSERHITKMLITHDGVEPIATEFGVVYTSSELATFDIDILGPVCRINARAASSNSTTFKIVATLIE